MKSRIAEENSH